VRYGWQGRQEDALLRWLVMIVLGLGLLTPLVVQATPLQPPVTPEAFMPAAQDLPVGFVEDRAQETWDSSDKGSLLTRQYTRESNPPSPELLTWLVVGVGVSSDPQTAAVVFDEIVALWERDIGSLEPVSALLAEDAVVARMTEEHLGHQFESVHTGFRNGPVFGFVSWTARAELPNLENALSVAQPLAARTRAYADRALPTPGTPTTR
jgi:hypothetical protein